MAKSIEYKDLNLSNVLLGYVKVKEAAVRYGMKAGVSDKFKGDEFEYGASLFLTKAEANKFKKAVPNTKKKLNPMDADEVREALKLDADFELAEENYWRLNVNVPKFRLNRKTEEVYEADKPRIFIKEGGKAVEITNTRLVSNGSVANVKLNIMSYDSPIDGKPMQKVGFGKPAMFVTSFIEYQSGGSNIDSSDEMFEGMDVELEPEEAKVKAEAAEVDKLATASDTPFDDDDDLEF